MEVTVFCSLMPQKIHRFKAKDSFFCLGNISKDVSVDDMKKTGSNGCLWFSLDYNIIDTSNIINVHKCLMK